MKFLLLLFSFLATLFGDKILTIASYNVENLFDIEKSGYEYHEYIPNTSSNWNQKNYKIKLQNIAKVIKDIDADIIALQEVESLQALLDLRFALKQKGLYYEYYKIADKKNTTVKVAILSKIPFVYSKELSVTQTYQYRNILETKFKINNKELYIFINHWKSKSGAESKRIISAKVLRKRIEELGLDKNLIILGDFNSDYEEYIKFKRKRNLNDTNGKTGINHILQSVKQNKKAAEVIYDKDSLYNLWYDTDEENRYTYIFKGKKETLDNILISQPLLDKNGIYYIDDSIKNFDEKYLFKRKSIHRWEISKKEKRHKGRGYSDHLAIVAKFIVKE